MPRRARVRLPHVPLHVLQRGVNRTTCFFSDFDRTFFLRSLATLSEKYQCAVHAYVLMTNHVHLLVTPSDRHGVSLMMRDLGQRYVQYVNRLRKRTGGLWEGRYRGNFIDTESYLLNCYRYIELNPVRAGMVLHPRDYPWSSYGVNAEGAAPAFIQPHPVFLSLGPDCMTRRNAYISLFGSDLELSIVEDFRRSANSGSPLGTADFIERAEHACGRRLTPAKRGRKPRA
jgi:putative transposase